MLSVLQRGGGGTGGDLDSAPNPFLPPDDEQVFSMREAERRSKREVRGHSGKCVLAAVCMPCRRCVWPCARGVRLVQRGGVPYGCTDRDPCHVRPYAAPRHASQQRDQLRRMKVWEKTTQSSRMGRTRRIADIEDQRDGNNVSRQAKHTRGLVAAATAAISQDRRREKENMADFIAKKREMFLVQMSLDTKREEIRKVCLRWPAGNVPFVGAHRQLCALLGCLRCPRCPRCSWSKKHT